MKKLLFLWVLVLTTFSLKAQSEVLIGDLYYNLYGDNTAEVTRLNSGQYDDIIDLIELIIPASVEQAGVSYAVTSIRNSAFKDCWFLTSITLPESVTSIGEGAFMGSSLSTFNFPKNVTSIADSVLYNCSSLTSVTIPNSVTSIGYDAFESCTSLTSITISESVTRIESSTFRNCSSLTSITIPNSVRYIGDSAFESCISLTSITIPESVTRIEMNTFSNCSSLTSITIPNSVIYIGGSAFESCISLTSITISESVTSIEYSTFSNCSSLTSITIPESVTSIGDDAFYGISNLKVCCEGDLPATLDSRVFTSTAEIYVHNVEEYKTAWSTYASQIKSAEFTCTLLGDAALGLSMDANNAAQQMQLQSDGTYTLSKTDISMSEGTYSYTARRTSEAPSFEPEDITSTLSITTAGKYDITFTLNPATDELTAQVTLKEQEQPEQPEQPEEEPIDPTWQILYTSTDGEIVTPNATDVFGANIVSNTYENGVGTITFDDPVTSIGDNAFFNCQNLSYIELPNSVTSIGMSAFANCTRLSSITIPNSVTSIGESAFARCTSLTSIAMPNSVTSIGVGAFCYCPSITTMVVEGRNSTYDSRENCNAIIETATNTLIAGCQNTIVPNTVTSIGMSAFSDCTSLTSITIPESVTSIGEKAFKQCSSLTSITIPESVTSIGKQAFYNCSQFSSVTIGCGVTSIGVEAFELCSQLTSVTIGSGVTNIGNWAFSNCSSLTSITCEATVPPTLGMYVFQFNLKTAYIPCGTKEVYEASDWAQYVSEFVEECEAEQYTRDITPNRYGTICLPFGSTDFSGATFYEIAYKAPFIIYFDEVTTLEAGKPYVFYAHSNKLVVTSDGTRVNNPLFDNGLYGTFDEIIAAATNILTNNYIVNNNSLCMCGEYCSLPANRAYIKLDEVSSTARALAPGRKRVSLSVQEENTSTALDNISEDTENIPAQKGVYDILGRKMLEPTGIGFYIIDGQKVIIAK